MSNLCVFFLHLRYSLILPTFQSTLHLERGESWLGALARAGETILKLCIQFRTFAMKCYELNGTLIRFAPASSEAMLLRINGNYFLLADTNPWGILLRVTFPFIILHKYHK